MVVFPLFFKDNSKEKKNKHQNQTTKEASNAENISVKIWKR